MPCPRGGPTFRPIVKKMGGKFQFPYLVYEKYGPVDSNQIPDSFSNSFWNTLSLSFAMLARLTKGSAFTENKFAMKSSTQQPLIYYGYEGSPFCKLVREKLVEYEIPHIQKTCPRGMLDFI